MSPSPSVGDIILNSNCQNSLTSSNACITVMILSFRTGLGKQCRPRSDCSYSLTRVYTVCNSLYIVWTHYSMVKPPCSNVRVITADFPVSEFLGVLRYCYFKKTIWAASWQNQQNDAQCAQWRFRSAWASAQSDQSSLWAQWVAKGPNFLHADSKYSDQTGRMPRLIWVFAGHTLTLLVLSRGGSFTVTILNIRTDKSG